MCEEEFQQIIERAYIVCQLFYFFAYLADIYILTLPKNVVNMQEGSDIPKTEYPFIILLYPVLKEPKETMRTSFQAMKKLDYPRKRYRIISVPNSHDKETIQSLKELQEEFDFLEIMQVPPTTDPSWEVVWKNWDNNENAYWWHRGVYAKERDLPPKKTRQLTYAFYHLFEERKGEEDFLVNYIDADTCLPSDHFFAAAIGIRHYDVLQATNIAGNINDTLTASFCALDHLIWDGYKYPHLSANGKHPYWVLGKALFYKASDLNTLGAFHPWIAIEDPEVGLRLWRHGKKLGIIETPVIEEVPRTLRGAIVQRKRWVCGFFQTLSFPMIELKLTPFEMFLAWANFVPCLAHWINFIAWPSTIWAFWGFINGDNCLPLWVIYLSIFNVSCGAMMLVSIYYLIWTRTKLVLASFSSRLWYLIRVNPIFLLIWWLLWLIPITLGFFMFIGSGGLVWVRTTKVNANAQLFGSKIIDWFRQKIPLSIKKEKK